MDKLFGNIVLPVRPALAVDGATIRVIDEPAVDEQAKPFFGGYAEDFLGGLGFDMVDEPADKATKLPTKRA